MLQIGQIPSGLEPMANLQVTYHRHVALTGKRVVRLMKRFQR